MKPKIKKKSKTSKNPQESPDLDPLSSLPDSILSHIFSFLDTRSATRTAVLSKRFHLVWTITTNLDFELPAVPYGPLKPYADGFHFPPRKNPVKAFEAFVDYVLQNREPISLTSFSLAMHHFTGVGFLEGCLDYAAKHKVQNLSIRAFLKFKPVALPKKLLTSSFLITLRLNNATTSSIELPKSVLLPNLKVLALKNFEFWDGSYNGELFSGCPCLEELVLNKCCVRPGGKLKVLKVSCLMLKSLEIMYWRSPWKVFDECMINVNAPGLVCFKLVGHLVRINFNERSPCLNRAVVDLYYPTSCAVVNLKDRLRKNAEVFSSMLCLMSSVVCLVLSWMTIEVLSILTDLGVHSSIVFENLRYIKFSAEDKYAETTLPVETVRQMLEKVRGDKWTFDVPKELRQKKAKTRHGDANCLPIPVNAMHYLLDSSPSAESLCIEIPKVDRRTG